MTTSIESLQAVLDLVISERDELKLRIAQLETQIEELRCGELDAFTEGELPEPRANAFRDHLMRCETCQAGLVEIEQINARISEIAPSLQAVLDLVISKRDELKLRIAQLETQIEELRCGELVAFTDGELPEPRANAFRDHLMRCETCQAGLVEIEQINARISEIAPSATRGG